MVHENNHFAKAEMLIRKPVHEVFEAFINPEITTKFWFTKSSGKLEEGTTTRWTWDMYNHSTTVKTNHIIPNKKIEIEWGNQDTISTVEWIFTKISEFETFVSITNKDLSEYPDKVLSEVRNATEGFALVLAGAKAYLEHGIMLNLVGDRFPRF
ncbi:MAG: SRPBCC family protein [Flavobacteriaceae bacterium]